jgi:hypothetical protein
MTHEGAIDWYEHFIYNAETGDLIWKERQRSKFKSEQSFQMWMTRFCGKVAGCVQVDSYGYTRAKVVRILGKLYYTHRIVWSMNKPDVPEGLWIDHINGNPQDNRLSNLRLVTTAQNAFNTRLSSTNTTGVKGVCFVAARGKHKAEIRVSGRRIHLGYFPTKGLAAVARAKAAIKYHGEFARLT